MTMRSKLWFILLVSMILMISGCASLEPQQKLGATNNQEDGFRILGTNRARSLEGPLSDLLVPDDAPKTRISLADEIAEKNLYYAKEKDLGFENQGINRAGSRVVDLHPGSMRDDYLLRDKPQMKKKQTVKVQSANLVDEIRVKIKAIEKIENVYVVKDGNIVLIGVEASEQNRRKLKEELNEVIADIKKSHPNVQFKIATDRATVGEIRQLENRK